MHRVDDNNLPEPFKAEYEAQQRPLDKVARFDVPEPWRWNGNAYVRLSNRVVIGPTSIGMVGSTIKGEIVYQSRSTHPYPTPSHDPKWALSANPGPSAFAGFFGGYDYQSPPEWDAGYHIGGACPSERPN